MNVFLTSSLLCSEAVNHLSPTPRCSRWVQVYPTAIDYCILLIHVTPSSSSVGANSLHRTNAICLNQITLVSLRELERVLSVVLRNWLNEVYTASPLKCFVFNREVWTINSFVDRYWDKNLMSFVHELITITKYFYKIF